MPRLNRDIDLAIKAAMGAVAGGMMFAPDEAEAIPKFPKNIVKSFDDVISDIPVSIRAWHGTPFAESVKAEGFKLPMAGERNPLTPNIQSKFKLRSDLDAQGLLGRGVYSTDSKSFAKTWGEPVEIDVNLAKPYVIDNASIDDLRRLDLDALREQGYDGIVVKKGRYGLTGETYRQGIAFDPSSVEVATTPFAPSRIVKGAVVKNPETGETGTVRAIRPLSENAKEFWRERGEGPFNNFLEVRWKGKKGVAKPRTEGNVRDTAVELSKILASLGPAALATLGLTLTADEANAMYVGPKSKGWDSLVGKFSSLMDRMERAEISDAGAKIIQDKIYPGFDQSVGRGSLDTFLSHPKLFERYPSLRGLTTDIHVSPSNANTGALNKDLINISANQPADIKSTLLHEIQHAIQEKEGWARGGSPGAPIPPEHRNKYIRETFDKIRPSDQKAGVPISETWQTAKDFVDKDTKVGGRYSYYINQAGEIEARDTAARMGLSATERASKLPFSGQGIPLRDVITKGGGKAASQQKQWDVFRVNLGGRSVVVTKNPSYSDLYEMSRNFRKEHPNAGDTPYVRSTKDAEGNEYVWNSFDALHSDIEPVIDRKFGTRTHQGGFRYFDTKYPELRQRNPGDTITKMGVAAPVAIGAAGAMMPMEAGAAPTKPVMTMTDIVNKWRAEGRQIPYLMEKEAWREQAQAGGRTKGLEEAINPAEYLMPARVGGGVVNMAIDAAMRGVGF